MRDSCVETGRNTDKVISDVLKNYSCSRQRERRSQNDLKRQFEEFSRNLSFRNRSKKKGGGGGGNNNNHVGKRASTEIPTIIAVDEEDVSSPVNVP